MPINEHVEDGLFQHRRVNDPALANRTRKEGDALRTRSVSISSERLGISGKLDLLEEKGEATRPVEYKRSAAPKDEAGEPTFWDNDAIQLCAQGLLVEESLGVAVPSGILYYIGSKARVDVPFDESLRARTTGGDRADPRAVGAGRRARAPAGRAAAPLLRLLAGPDLPARGDALPDPPARARASAGRDHPRRAAGAPVARGVADARDRHERRQGRALPARAGLARRTPQRPPGGLAPGPGGEPGADRLGAAGGRLRQRAGLDPGPAHAGRGRDPGVVPLGLRQVHRGPGRAPGEEHGAAGRTVPGLLRPGAVARPGPGRRRRQDRQPADAADALAAQSSGGRGSVRAGIDGGHRVATDGCRRSGLPVCCSPHAPVPRPSANEPAARDMAELLARVPTAPDLGVLLGLEGQAAALYFAQLRPDAQGPVPRRRVRLHRAEPPPAPRPGQCAVELRLRASGQGLLLGRAARSASTRTTASTTSGGMAGRRWPSTSWRSSARSSPIPSS